MYIRTIIFFLLCGSILLNSHAANINESFQEANDLIIAGNFKDAKKILLDLEELNPNNYQIITKSRIRADPRKLSKDYTPQRAPKLDNYETDICRKLSCELI